MLTYSLIAFVTYFAILLVIAVISHQKQDTNTEFAVGNRSLNFFLTALSAHASDMSAWIFMGLPASIYLGGLIGVWIPVGLLIGMFLNWQFVATRLRKQTENYDACTLSTFFERHYKDTSGAIRLITAFMMLFFLTHYISAALTGMGLLLEAVFGIDYYFSLCFAMLVVVAYTFGGGFVTIAWTDLFQALFLLFVLLVVPMVAYFSMTDGWGAIQKISADNSQYLSVLGDGSSQAYLAALLIAIGWGIGYFGQPHIITKFMGIKDVNEMNKSKYVGMTWQFFALFASIATGIVGAAYFDLSLEDPELVFIEMVKSLLHPYFAGMILCGVLAATLSTMDSQLLVCASVIGEDLYKHILHKKALPLQIVRASRLGVLLIASIALILAFLKSETIMSSVFYAWTGLGAAFGPLVIMTLYSKKANKYGALAGILVGGLIAAFWPRDHFLNAMIPGFFLSLLSIYVVSLFYHRFSPQR